MRTTIITVLIIFFASVAYAGNGSGTMQSSQSGALTQNAVKNQKKVTNTYKKQIKSQKRVLVTQ